MNKTIFKVVAAMVFCVCLIGCGSNPETKVKETKNTENTSTETSITKETTLETNESTKANETSSEDVLESRTTLDEAIEQLRSENDTVLQAPVEIISWEQEDPVALKQLLEQDESFVKFAHGVLAYTASYSIDDTEDIYRCLISSSAGFYGGIECFPFFDYPKDENSTYHFPASEIRWLALNLYNLDEESFSERQSFFEEMWKSTGKYGYHDGTFVVPAAGPTINAYRAICGIVDMEINGNVLKITFFEDIPQEGDIFTILPWGTDISEIGQARLYYMAAEIGQIEVNGVRHWTLYSVSKDYQ